MIDEEDSTSSNKEYEHEKSMLEVEQNERALSLNAADKEAALDISQSIGLQKQTSRISKQQSARQSVRLSHHSFFMENFGQHDCIDSVPDYMSFTILDAVGLLFSIGSYLFDIITDITVATLHYLNNNYWYFRLTITFVTLPTLLMTIISLRWYILDSREATSPKASKFQWFLRIFFLCFQLGPIMRYIDSLLYGFKFRQTNSNLQTARQFYQYMIYEDTDATMLRLFECFLEAAPQLILQIYILAVSTSHIGGNRFVAIQIISTFASLTSLSWSLVSYFRILRMSLPNKQNMTWRGTIVQFLWRFFMIGSRVLALALFASIFSYYIGFLCALHWLLMFLWIVSMKTMFCENRIEELFYNAVLGVIFIFCYFNPVDSATRYRYTIYYSFILLENSFILALWFTYSDPKLWYHIPGFIGYYVFFFTGLIFMALYYLKFHPNLNRKLKPNRNIANQTVNINTDINIISMDLANSIIRKDINNGSSEHNYNEYGKPSADVWTTEQCSLPSQLNANTKQSTNESIQ